LDKRSSAAQQQMHKKPQGSDEHAQMWPACVKHITFFGTLQQIPAQPFM